MKSYPYEREGYVLVMFLCSRTSVIQRLTVYRDLLLRSGATRLERLTKTLSCTTTLVFHSAQGQQPHRSGHLPTSRRCWRSSQPTAVHDGLPSATCDGNATCRYDRSVLPTGGRSDLRQQWELGFCRPEFGTRANGSGCRSNCRNVASSCCRYSSE